MYETDNKDNRFHITIMPSLSYYFYGNERNSAQIVIDKNDKIYTISFIQLTSKKTSAPHSHTFSPVGSHIIGIHLATKHFEQLVC